jgi:hypothetical protein
VARHSYLRDRLARGTQSQLRAGPEPSAFLTSDRQSADEEGLSSRLALDSPERTCDFGRKGEVRVPKQQRSEGLRGYAAVAIVAFLIGRCSASDDGPVQPAAAVAPVSQTFTEAGEDFASPARPERGETTAEPAMSVGASGASPTDSAAFAGAAIVPEVEEPTDVYYRNCSAARAAGAAPIHVGEPGYASHLDRDDDGVACE